MPPGASVPPQNASVAASLSPVPQSLCLQPFVMPALLTGVECHDLISLFESCATARSLLTGGAAQSSIRSSTGLWIDDQDAPWLTGRLAALASAACRTAFPFDIDGFEEGYQMLRYDAPQEDASRDGVRGGDFYDWHVDVGAFGTARSRKLTLIIQLSDPAHYEGGGLELNASGAAEPLPRAQGIGLAFPSFMPHRVSPVTAGVRYSFVAWLHGPAFH